MMVASYNSTCRYTMNAYDTDDASTIYNGYHPTASYAAMYTAPLAGANKTRVWVKNQSGATRNYTVKVWCD